MSQSNSPSSAPAQGSRPKAHGSPSFYASAASAVAAHTAYSAAPLPPQPPTLLAGDIPQTPPPQKFTPGQPTHESQAYDFVHADDSDSPDNSAPDADPTSASPEADGLRHKAYGSAGSKRGRPPTHGLTRPLPVIAAEDKDNFIAFRDAIFEDLRPQDAHEIYLAEQIINHRFFIFHADRAEAAALRQVMRSGIRTPLPEVAFPAAPQSESERFNDALADSAADHKVHLILRYRATHERAVDRCERLFRAYRESRLADLMRMNRIESDAELYREKARQRAESQRHGPSSDPASPTQDSAHDFSPAPNHDPSSSSSSQDSGFGSQDSSFPNSDPSTSSASQDSGPRTQDFSCSPDPDDDFPPEPSPRSPRHRKDSSPATPPPESRSEPSEISNPKFETDSSTSAASATQDPGLSTQDSRCPAQAPRPKAGGSPASRSFSTIAELLAAYPAIEDPPKRNRRNRARRSCQITKNPPPDLQPSSPPSPRPANGLGLKAYGSHDSCQITEIPPAPPQSPATSR